VEINTDQPVLVDKYIMGKELEVDAICDGTDVFIPGIMEHVERTGVHSGDSISIYPTFSVSQAVKDKIIDYTVKLGTAIGIVGLYNIQFIADSNDDVYVIEVNPRSSRTVPFLSKATSVPMAHIATQVILGHSLKEQGITEVYPKEKKRWYVKAPAFSFSKLKGMDTYLSPEMKSTGEAIGYDKTDPIRNSRLRLGFLGEEGEDGIRKLKRVPGIKKPKEKKPPRERDSFNLIKGTKKSYCYELTEKGFDQERVVRRMKKKFPDANEKSIQLWYRAAKRKLNGKTSKG
jgi:hypothetical protein